MISIAALVRAGGEAILRGIISSWEGGWKPGSVLSESGAAGILSRKIPAFGDFDGPTQRRFIRDVWNGMQAGQTIATGGVPTVVPLLPGTVTPSGEVETTYVAKIDLGDGAGPVEVVGLLRTSGTPTMQDVRQDASDALQQQKFRDTPRGGNKRGIERLSASESIPVLIQVRILSTYRV